MKKIRHEDRIVFVERESIKNTLLKAIPKPASYFIVTVLVLLAGSWFGLARTETVLFGLVALVMVFLTILSIREGIRVAERTQYDIPIDADLIPDDAVENIQRLKEEKGTDYSFVQVVLKCPPGSLHNRLADISRSIENADWPLFEDVTASPGVVEGNTISDSCHAILVHFYAPSTSDPMKVAEEIEKTGNADAIDIEGFFPSYSVKTLESYEIIRRLGQ